MKAIESSNAKALEDLLKVQDVLEKLRTQSVWDLVGQTKPAMDRAMENIRKNDGKLRRIIRSSGTLKSKRTKAEIAKSAKLKRQRQNSYRNRLGAKREAVLLQDGGTAASWYDILSRPHYKSDNRKQGWKIGKAEWEEAVGDSLKNSVCVIYRYNTYKPWTLDNVYVVDVDTRKTLFCGAEHAMRSMGYIL